MQNYKFINFTPAPHEKFLGYARVLAYGKITLVYKIVLTKDGKSFYPSTANYKATLNNEQKWICSWYIDSINEQRELCKYIQDAVLEDMKKNNLFPELVHAMANA